MAGPVATWEAARTTWEDAVEDERDTTLLSRGDEEPRGEGRTGRVGPEEKEEVVKTSKKTKTSCPDCLTD